MPVNSTVANANSRRTASSGWSSHPKRVTKRSQLIGLSTAVCFVALSVAHTPAHSQSTTQLHSEDGESQTELNRDTAKQLIVTERHLNAVYQDLIKSVGGDSALVAKIKESERRWLTFRESFIEAAYPTSGPHSDNGSALPTFTNELRTQLTQEQIEHLLLLKRLYSGK